MESSCFLDFVGFLLFTWIDFPLFSFPFVLFRADPAAVENQYESLFENQDSGVLIRTGLDVGRNWRGPEKLLILIWDGKRVERWRPILGFVLDRSGFLMETF